MEQETPRSGRPRPARKRRSDGEQSRNTILEEAARLATVEGIGGLSIGRLADAVGMSKSGLFAHFGSKEELQLATIRAARAIFAAAVVTPAQAEPGGMARLRALLEGWLHYSRSRAFPGGCFFSRTTHEYAARPSTVRDALRDADEEWLGLVAGTIDEARGLGEVRADVDSRQVAYELDSYLDSATMRSLLGGDLAVYDAAKAAVDARLASIAVG
jgi:AcrR family transcriptional regulator